MRKGRIKEKLRKFTKKGNLTVEITRRERMKGRGGKRDKMR